MENELSGELKAQAIDHVAAGARAILGAVPVAGPLLTEIATSIIPGQRIDRLADFAAKLSQRIDGLEQKNLETALDDVEFTDLVEEAMRQASRATSEERRDYLASLVANSLTSDAREHAESKHLMRLLGELNDIEVLWLRFYADPTMGGDEEFRALHEDVFRPVAAHMGSSREELDQKALQDSYRNHLLQLGLLSQKVDADRDGMAKVDVHTGDFKHKSRQASSLGRLLLRSIGLLGD